VGSFSVYSVLPIFSDKRASFSSGIRQSFQVENNVFKGFILSLIVVMSKILCLLGLEQKRLRPKEVNRVDFLNSVF